MATTVGTPAHSDERSADERRRAEAVRQLLAEWLADETGYDEHAWQELKRGLEESRTSSRPLFRA
jgi:hypothetical protein